MGHWIDKLLDEPTVYWESVIRDGLGGYSGVSTPVQLVGRWEYSVSTTGPNVSYATGGAVLTDRISVWLDSQVVPQSYLWKGRLSDITDLLVLPDDAVQVVAVENVRSIPTTRYLYKAYLDEG